jgi:predicted enzyme related to lactoylglutathione lyase
MGQPVTQFQILAKNPDKAAKFYGDLFGWSIDSNNAMGYRVVQTGSGEGIQGGIWPAPPEGHAMVQLFVQVEDVKATVEKATAVGGKIIIGPQALPDGDEMAVILDSEGIPFGLMKRRG